MIDSDEFIVPRLDSTLSDMALRINNGSKVIVPELRFKNTVFLTDASGVKLSHDALVTMRSLHHLENEHNQGIPYHRHLHQTDENAHLADNSLLGI